MSRLAAIFVNQVTVGKILLWLGISVLLVLSFALYFVPVIYELTGGLRPIDTQIPITPEVIFRDLAQYPPEAISVYFWFLVVDCFYPAALATFIAYFWAWAIRYCDAQRLRTYALKGFVLLPFAGALLDLAENVGFFMIIAAWPEQSLWAVAQISTALRQAKLTVQIADILITLFMLGMVIRTFIRMRSSGASA